MTLVPIRIRDPSYMSAKLVPFLYYMLKSFYSSSSNFDTFDKDASNDIDDEDFSYNTADVASTHSGKMG